MRPSLRVAPSISIRTVESSVRMLTDGAIRRLYAPWLWSETQSTLRLTSVRSWLIFSSLKLLDAKENNFGVFCFCNKLMILFMQKSKNIRKN